MQTRTVEQVESWESRPFSGGFAALHDLSDEEFTGAVVADSSWLFMLNGRVVGVFGGDIDDFDASTGTVYTAPHESLPLLFSMQERGGSTRAKYFTNDTSIREADQTLTDANFTGYVELSENVLSGDYYLVYYGGKQMSAAFIGQSERLLTGSEAYDRAADEVGIYEVKDVSMNITEIPTPASPEPEPDTAVGVGTAAGSADEESVTDADSPSETEPAGSDVEPAEANHTADTATPDDEPASPGEKPAGPGETQEESVGGDLEDVVNEAESSDRAESGPPDEPSDASVAGNSSGEVSGTDRPDQGSADPTEEAGSSASGDEHPDRETVEAPQAEDSLVESREADEEKDELQRMFEEEEEWRQTRSIPSLNPSETEDTGERGERPSRQPPQGSTSARSQQPTETATSQTSGVSEDRVAELKAAIEKREEQIEQLSTSMESVRNDRSEMQGELEELREERTELEERISNLESALQRAKDQQAAIDTTATEISPEEALTGTNLFVRYDSKGKPTLDALGAGGEVDPEAVNANLRLEHHTQFEAEDVVVENLEFEDFLEGTSAYQFVSWVVRTLPYELLHSGKRSALGDLYEAIPEIDRIEFEGEVSVPTPDGEPVTAAFGVVMRDRMGNPLIVAELNDERDPVRGEEMDELIESSTTVGDGEPSLSGAFYVTASFFEPAALEAAEGAASKGGLFSRSDKASYVKTASKSGFHLCLVEDRAESFHVTVPEL